MTGSLWVTLWRPGGRSRGIESSAAQNAPSRPTVRAFQAIFTRPGPAAEAAAPCGDFSLRMKCGLDLLTESISHFVESPEGLSPSGAPRTVLEPLDSHGSRCSAIAMT